MNIDPAVHRRPHLVSPAARRRVPLVSPAVIAMIIMVLLSGCKQDRSSDGRTFTDKAREIFILNNLAETVSVYHPDSGQLYNNVFTTGRAPNDILFYNDSLYIVCSTDNTIEVYDETSFRKIGEIYLGPGNNPYSIIQGTGTHSHIAYIPNFVSETVSVINLNTLQLTGTIDPANPDILRRPQDGAVMGDYLFICNTDHDGSAPGDGSVAVFAAGAPYDHVADILTGSGSNPQTALPLPALEELHVYLTGDQTSDDGEILILDVSSILAGGTGHTVTSRLPVGGSPAMTGSAWDSVSGTVFLTGTYGLYRYDALSGTLPAAPGANPVYELTDPSADLLSGVAFDGVNDILVVANFGEDSLLILEGDDFSTRAALQASDGPLAPHLFIE